MSLLTPYTHYFFKWIYGARVGIQCSVFEFVDVFISLFCSHLCFNSCSLFFSNVFEVDIAEFNSHGYSSCGLSRGGHSHSTESFSYRRFSSCIFSSGRRSSKSNTSSTLIYILCIFLTLNVLFDKAVVSRLKSLFPCIHIDVEKVISFVFFHVDIS